MTGFPEQSLVVTPPQGAFASYVAAIRAHPVVVALVTLAAVAASVAFLLVRSSEYEATADLLVNALPQEDEVFLGLPLLRESGDPVRTVQTAASLVEARQAGQIAADAVGGDWTAEDVLEAVEVAPRGESNVLGITATADSASEAARLANQFAAAALEVRADAIAAQTEARIEQLDAQLRALPADDITRPVIASQRDQLQAVLSGGDPTLQRSQDAIPPTAAVGAPPALILVLAVFAGFVLGSGTALLLELLARRVRDADDAFRLYPLPVVARVPEVPEKKLRGARGTTWYMPPEIREPFRTLALQLEQRTGSHGAVMVTSASSGDGKTSSSINLAVSLAASGMRVILLDFDLRKPQVGTALGIRNGHTMTELLDPAVSLEQLLFSASELSSLRVLPLVLSGDAGGLIDVSGLRLPTLLEEARELADYVVVDTAPLGEVGDALRLAREVDDVLVVLRPGNTDRSHLRVMRDLFQGVGREATGYLLLSGSDGASRGYYAHGHAHREVFGLEREYAASEEPSADQAEAAEEKSAAARRSQSEKATRGAT